MRHLRSLVTLSLIVTSAVFAHAQIVEGEQPDNYAWLEDVNGKRSMDWVIAHNKATEKVFEADPRLKKLRAEALKVAESPDRLPSPDLRHGMVYNFWQDAKHVRGILRRTTLKDYQSSKPHWSTVLDYDVLAKKDKKSWVNGGGVDLFPGDRKSLIGLSDGGEDAVTYREFDLRTGKFVKGGFTIPKAKSNAAWVDGSSLLVTSDWGGRSMTASGYPFIAKYWKRGTPLSSAKEVFRGTTSDVAVDPWIVHDGQGNQANLLIRARTFWESEIYLWGAPDKLKMLGLPKKNSLYGLLDNQLVFTTNEDWKPSGMDRTFPQGSILAVDMGAARRDPLHLKPTVVFEPSATEFAQEVSMTRDRVLLTTLDNVQGRAYLCRRGSNGAWTRKALPVPDNRAVSIASTDSSDDHFFLTISGFIAPQSLYVGDTGKGTLKVAKTRKPQFDASGLTVGQLWATSSDGTKVPYFIVHRKGMKYDGNNPTLLYAYGGFLSSSTPYYSGTLGKLWLERGGVFVLANIRGGAEFGPAWHAAGLKTKRQLIYDDFAAVGKDLCDRQITSPRRLGIQGGSNGGLLVGVAMTQHPEQWNAVVIDIPLLDMLGYEHIAAGASWVGEYGSVSVPEERKFLASISPYNQLRKDATYPEPFIFTTTKDDRVGPVHARKFAARMEEFGKPFYYMEIVEGGHGSGADLKQQANSAAFSYLYLIRKLMD